MDLWEPKVLRSGAGAHFRVPVHQGIHWDNLEQLVHLEKASVYLADSSAREGGGLGVPARNYADVDFASEPGAWVLVLGGETQGLSAEAHHLAQIASAQCRLHIPLAGGVDSLNAAAALAVLMFEMRRQRGISQGNPLASLATLQ